MGLSGFLSPPLFAPFAKLEITRDCAFPIREFRVDIFLTVHPHFFFDITSRQFAYPLEFSQIYVSFESLAPLDLQASGL